MTDLYGCGRHRTDGAREVTVMTLSQPPIGKLPDWEGQMHVIREEDTVSICHTDPEGKWCPEVFSFSPEDVHATDPLDAWNFNCSVCQLRGGFADNTFVRMFAPTPDQHPSIGYPFFKRWEATIKRLWAEQERREKAEK